MFRHEIEAQLIPKRHEDSKKGPSKRGNTARRELVCSLPQNLDNLSSRCFPCTARKEQTTQHTCLHRGNQLPRKHTNTHKPARKDQIPSSSLLSLSRSLSLWRGVQGRARQARPFFFFFTLFTGPRRSLSLKLSDTGVDQIVQFGE